MKVCFLFPQILNAIDIELAEHNCLDCSEYVNRLVLSTKPISDGLREGRRIPRLLVGDECDGIRFKYLAKPPSRDAPTFGRRESLGCWADAILL